MTVEHIRNLLDQVLIATRALTANQQRKEAMAATYSNAMLIVRWLGMSRTMAHDLIDRAYDEPGAPSTPPPTREEIEAARTHKVRLERSAQLKHPMAVSLGQCLILLAGTPEACTADLFRDTLDGLRIALDLERKDIDAAKMREELADGLVQFARSLRAGIQ